MFRQEKYIIQTFNIKTFMLARYSFKVFRSCCAASSALRLCSERVVKKFKKKITSEGREGQMI